MLSAAAYSADCASASNIIFNQSKPVNSSQSHDKADLKVIVVTAYHDMTFLIQGIQHCLQLVRAACVQPLALEVLAGNPRVHILHLWTHHNLPHGKMLVKAAMLLMQHMMVCNSSTAVLFSCR